MKRALIILAMISMAATTYNQTPRRATSTNTNASRTEARSNTPAPRSTSTSPAVNTQPRQNRPSAVNSEPTQTRSTTTTTTRTTTTNQNPPRSKPSDNNVQQNNNPGNNAREHQNPAGNTPKPRENDYNARTNSNQTEGNGRTYDNPSNNNTRTTGTPTRSANNNSRSNDGYSRPVEAHHTNNVNANVHADYPTTRVYRGNHEPNHGQHNYNPQPKTYREVHYIYREPVHYDIYWTREMHRHYCEMYPEVHYWRYDEGYHINTVSAYRADFYIGEVMNVYGQVSDVYYAAESDEYFLYVGPYFPYQDFTVVVPGWVARNYSYRPYSYFLNQNINVTGLITAYEGTPEIVVKRNFQINVY